jgi:putative Mg2+ transporter-C (MgtC) family protein
MDDWFQTLGEALRGELVGNFPDVDQAVRVLVRLTAAAVLGGVIGCQRESEGKEAGLRTQLVVSLASALFVLGPLEFGRTLPGWNDNVGRVVQGLAAGLGFVGGGVILKLTDKEQVRGLTTAASIWLSAAAGVSAGLGRYWQALFGVLLTLLALAVLPRLGAKPKSGKGGPVLSDIASRVDL